MAYNFTAASSQYLSCAAPVTDTPLTIACWVWKSDITTGGNALIALSDVDTLSDNFYLSHQVSTNRIRAGVQFAGGTLTNAITSTGMTNSTWHHACGVWTSSTSRTAYIDGGSTGTNATSAAPQGITTLLIGAAFFATFSGTFPNARMAEVGIWNVALTADEIASLAKGMSCDKVRPQNLQFYAPLVRTLQDVRGGLTITNNNTATVAAHPRVYA